MAYNELKGYNISRSGGRYENNSTRSYCGFFCPQCHAAANPAHGAQKPPLRLTADLTIGLEDGDENFIFKSVSRIDLDKEGRIYALDYKDSKVRIFDSSGKFLNVIPIPVGQGPRELSQIAAMAVSPNGLVFLNEMRKVVVYDREGSFIRSFPLDFNAMTIGNAGDENVVVIGLKDGKILHDLIAPRAS